MKKKLGLFLPFVITEDLDECTLCPMTSSAGLAESSLVTGCTRLKIEFLVVQSKFGRVIQGSSQLIIFWVSPQKDMLWVPIRIALQGNSKWVPTTYMYMLEK